MWSYIFFFIHLNGTKVNDYTALEMYVYKLVSVSINPSSRGGHVGASAPYRADLTLVSEGGGSILVKERSVSASNM